MTALQPPTPLRRTLHVASAAGAAALLLWIAGLVWFATPPVDEHRAAPTDAIVVLTGGSLRLRLHSGIDLLREGKGRELFVSGVNREVGLGQLLQVSGNEYPGWVLCCVVLGHEALDTLGNAQETARWMRRRGYRSLRLVTAWYHMPRSRLEFERAMPGIAIVPHPVFPDRVKREDWWAWRGSAALLIGEYSKYLAVLFRPLVERERPVSAEPIEAESRR